MKWLNLKLEGWTKTDCIIICLTINFSLFIALRGVDMKPPSMNIFLTDLWIERIENQTVHFDYYHQWDEFKHLEVFVEEEYKMKSYCYGLKGFLCHKQNSQKTISYDKEYKMDFLFFDNQSGILVKIIDKNGKIVFQNKDIFLFKIFFILRFRLITFILIFGPIIFNICAFFRIRHLIKME